MLIVMQGIPGSGKSTEARRWKKRLELLGQKTVVCSTDDFHAASGDYIFDFTRAGEYHFWNQWEADQLLAVGVSVIVDNTNILNSQARPYIDAAKKHRHGIIIHRCMGDFKTVHGVPEEVIARMRETMEEIVLE